MSILKKLIGLVIKDKDDYYGCEVVQVESTGKNIKEIIDSADIEVFPWIKDLKIKEYTKTVKYTDKFRHDREKTYVESYRFYHKEEGIYFDGVGYLHDSIRTYYNKVCIICGKCYDVHKDVLEEMDRQVKIIDERMEVKELAEKIWRDNCE